jgi:DNA-binding CsgD family transcriptional regulator
LRNSLRRSRNSGPKAIPVRDDTGADRFWAKVDKTSDCWLWTASTTRSGVGQFRTASGMAQAHRFAWELVFGTKPQGLLRHACGNLRCVRPDHMRQMARRIGPNSLSRDAQVRFRNLVDKTPTCWLWRGSTINGGYGQFRNFDEHAAHAGTMVLAHRFSWELERGKIPEGGDLIHICSNRTCVRPDHLALKRQDDRLTPTVRQLTVLRTWMRFGSRYGSLKAAASELGIAAHSAAEHLSHLRKRLGVHRTADAVTWLDEHLAGWRHESHV